MRSLHSVWVTFLLLANTALLAQQVKFIDVTGEPQRVRLRYPPAPAFENVATGGGMSTSISECGPEIRDPRSLSVYLQSAIVNSSDPMGASQVEFKVLNTGKVPLRLPVSPHLADLQPADSSIAFEYMSLALSASRIKDRRSIGYIELFGKEDAPGTVITLNPGEWLRVEARVKFNRSLPPTGTVDLLPGYWLRRVKFYPHPGGYSSAAENICID